MEIRANVGLQDLTPRPLLALRLQAALGTSPEMWMGRQVDYELWLATKTKRPRINPFPLAA